MKLYLEDNTDIPAVFLLEDSAPAPEGYSDKSQFFDCWERYGEALCTDYNQFRDFVGEQLGIKTWDNLTYDERDFIIKLNVWETTGTKDEYNAKKIAHILERGYASDLVSAKAYLTSHWARHHILDVKACVSRAESAKLFEVVGKYLSIDDAEDLFATTSNLYLKFIKQAVKGTLDDSPLGWFDYLENTPGTVYEFAGLTSKGYVMQNGDPDETNFISDIMGVLRHGNY